MKNKTDKYYKASSNKLRIWFFSYRYNTWEPEENILDVRLIELYEESQKGGDVTTRRPRRRDTRYSVNNYSYFSKK